MMKKYESYCMYSSSAKVGCILRLVPIQLKFLFSRMIKMDNIKFCEERENFCSTFVNFQL